MENLEKKLDSRSKVLPGVETGILIGGVLGIVSYLTNQDPEATKTMMDTINLVGQSIKDCAMIGYVGGHIYSAFSKYKA